MKLGLLKHDIGIFGHHKETGGDVNLELLFTSPDFLKIIGPPRPQILRPGGLKAPLLPALAAAWCLATAPAAAHAIIIAAKPDVGAVVAGPTLAIDLRFNSRIDHLRSRLWLTEGERPIAVR